MDPANPDYLLWRGHGQALVDAAYVAESFLRSYDQLWMPLEDITAIIVESERRTVRIPAISRVPFLHLADSRIDTVFVTFRSCLCQETLDGRRKQQPVGVRRVHTAQLGKFFKITFLGYIIQRQERNVTNTVSIRLSARWRNGTREMAGMWTVLLSLSTIIAVMSSIPCIWKRCRA